MLTKIITLALFSTFFILFFACRSYNTVRYLEYDTKCLNCGVTPDGILNVEIIKSVKYDSAVFITIKNLSEETVILDDKLFTGSIDNKIVLVPIGTENPYLRYTYSYTNLYSDAKPTYNFFLGYTGESKRETARTTIYEYEPKTPLSLPPTTTMTYYIQNYPLTLVNDRILLEKKVEDYSYVINWDNVNSYTKRMTENTFGIHICYRKINESDWKSFGLLYKPINIEIVNKKVLAK